MKISTICSLVAGLAMSAGLAHAQSAPPPPMVPMGQVRPPVQGQLLPVYTVTFYHAEDHYNGLRTPKPCIIAQIKRDLFQLLLVLPSGITTLTPPSFYGDVQNAADDAVQNNVCLQPPPPINANITPGSGS